MEVGGVDELRQRLAMEGVLDLVGRLSLVELERGSALIYGKFGWRHVRCGWVRHNCWRDGESAVSGL